MFIFKRTNKFKTENVYYFFAGVCWVY